MKWSTIALPTKHEVRGVWCDGRGLVLACGADGVFRSTDHGSTWTAIAVPVKSYVLDLHGTATSLLATSGGGVVLGSSDGGATWKKQKLPKGMPKAVWVAGDRAWVVGHAGYCAMRDAAGVWTTRDVGSTKDLDSVCVASDGTVWIVGRGTVLRSADGVKWVAAKGAPDDGFVVHPYGTGVVIGTRYGVKLSADGRTWQDVWGASSDLQKLIVDGRGGLYTLSTWGELKRATDLKTWELLREDRALQTAYVVGDRIACVTEKALVTSPPVKKGEVVEVQAEVIAASADEKLLERMLERWRTTRSPALADRIDALSERAGAHLPPLTTRTEYELTEAWLERSAEHRAGDLYWLLESFTRGSSRYHVDKRLEALAKWPADPRIATMIGALFATPPWTGENARRFWDKLGALAVELRDKRVLAIWKTIEATTERDKTYLSGWLLRSVPKLRAKLEATRDQPVPAAELAKLDKELASGAAPTSRSTASASALLEAVYARPDDDEPRSIYGDYLQECGDPRGELIALQLAAAPTAAQTKRIHALLATHGRTWLGALEPVVLVKDLAFERGFLARCRVQARVEKVGQQMVGKPEWSTVRAIDVSNWEFESWLPLVRGIPGLRELTGATYDALGMTTLELLGLGGGKHHPEHDMAALAKAKLPALKRLELRGRGGLGLSAMPTLWKSAFGKQLAHFACDTSETGQWLAHLLRNATLASFDVEGFYEGWTIAARRDGKRWHVRAKHPAKQTYTPPLEELWGYLADAPKSIGALELVWAGGTPEQRETFAVQVRERFGVAVT